MSDNLLVVTKRHVQVLAKASGFPSERLTPEVMDEISERLNQVYKPLINKDLPCIIREILER
jgi:hypothetical protein